MTEDPASRLVQGIHWKHLSPDLAINFQVTQPTSEGPTAGGQTLEQEGQVTLCPQVSGHRTSDSNRWSLPAVHTGNSSGFK